MKQLRSIPPTQGYPRKLHCLRCGQKMAKRTPKGDDQPRQVCPKCDWIFYNNPRPTVTAIIEKDDAVLLINRSRDPFKGDWDLIGGFVEPGETLEQALRREVKEEVRLQIINYQYYFSWYDIYENAVDKFVGYNVCIHFLVEVENKTPKPGDDAAEASWFLWKNLPKNIAQFVDVMKVIKKRKAELKEA